MKKKPAITSDRLILRHFESSDYLDLYEYLSDPEVVRFEPYEPFTLKQSKTEAQNRASCSAYWAVCLKMTGKVIGNLYLNQEEFDTYELGYVFNRLYQKQGYATESCKALLQYAFLHLKAHRIIALCSTENTNSWKLMERLSMRREGCFLQNATFKKDLHGNPIYFDSYEYAILRNDYMKINSTSIM